MNDLPTLDAHAHIAPKWTSAQLAETGYVLAMTFSLAGAEEVIGRKLPHIVWGVGCHPRIAAAQQAFDRERFRELVLQTAIVGEVGLETGIKVPMARQLEVFRAVLQVVSELPRLVSIHSFHATKLVLGELRRIPIHVPVLHWWTGSAEETSEAVDLGCYFSIHSAVARQSKFRTRVPPERMLIECDHGLPDPPAAIPLRIGWAEHLVAQQLEMEVGEVRRLVWNNFAEIVRRTATDHLLPGGFKRVMGEAARKGSQA